MTEISAETEKTAIDEGKISRTVLRFYSSLQFSEMSPEKQKEARNRAIDFITVRENERKLERELKSLIVQLIHILNKRRENDNHTGRSQSRL